MESENEVAARSKDHVAKGADEMSITELKHPEKIQLDLPPMKEKGHGSIDNGNTDFPSSDTHEKIKILEEEIRITKDAMENCKKQSLEEITHLRHKLQKSKSELEGASVDQVKLKSEASRLSVELAIFNDEATNAKIELQKTKEDCENLKEKVTMLDQHLSTADHKIREAEECLSAQVKAHQEELARRGDEERTIVKSLKDAKIELESVQGKVKALENVLTITEQKLKVHESGEFLQLQLTEVKASEKTQIKFLEEAKQNIELELHEKLNWEKKAEELQESLAMVQLEAENLKQKVNDLEVEMKGLDNEKFQLEERLRDQDEKYSQYENNVQGSNARNMELENLIIEHKTIADDSVTKIATLEARLVGARNQNAELETKLNEAQETILTLENVLKEIRTLTQEKDGLREELEKKEKELQTTLEEMDASVKQLQQGLSKEASLLVGTVDLKLQLEGALCKQQKYGEELEQKVKDSISIDEHKAQFEQLLATSLQYVNKLEKAENQLTDTKLEISKVQKAYNEQEIQYKELEAKSEKSEVVDQQSLGAMKSREIDVDLQHQSPGKVRHQSPDKVHDPASPRGHVCEVDQLEGDLFSVAREAPDFDTMNYPYPRYTDGTDAEAHVRAFLTTWQANHVLQRLVVADAETSKIAEFGLSLDGQAAHWYSQHDLGEFTSFTVLRDQFIRLFHRQVPKRELYCQFYTISQELQETIPQFTIRFQNLYHQLAREILADDLKDIFLAALREPLRTTLALVDFSQQTIEQVINRVLTIDRALPTTKESQFRHAIQCTTCLNTGHSAVDCTLRTHCPICHSRAHIIDQCEYNMLNRVVAPVPQIEPRNDRFRHEHFDQLSRFRDAERPQYKEHLRSSEHAYSNNYRYDYERDKDYEPRYRQDERAEKRSSNNSRFTNEPQLRNKSKRGNR